MNLGFRLLPNSDISLSDTLPDPEASTPWAGSQVAASRGDHLHPRLTSSHSGLVLDAASLCTVTFTRIFANKPAITACPVQAVGVQPVMLEVQSYIGSTGNWTGCVVHGYKGQTLPAVIALLGTLVNFNVFGASAAGTEFTLIALAIS